MTTAELIALLEVYPPGTPVFYDDGEWGPTRLSEIIRGPVTSPQGKVLADDGVVLPC